MLDILNSPRMKFVRVSVFNPLIGSESWNGYLANIDLTDLSENYVSSNRSAYKHEHFTQVELEELRKNICAATSAGRLADQAHGQVVARELRTSRLVHAVGHREAGELEPETADARRIRALLLTEPPVNRYVPEQEMSRGSNPSPSRWTALALLLLLPAPTEAQVNPSPDALGFDLGRIAFQENRGQWPASICFIARSRNIVARVEKSGLAFELRTGETNSEIDGVLVRMTIEGQDRTVSVGERELPGKHHYCLGSNSNWVRGVRTFARVRMPCVRDGVDWLLREHEGAFEYDLELAAGADLDTLTIHCQGQDGLSIEEDGSLWLHTPAGVMRQRPPVSCERLESGEWRSVEVRFQKLGDDRFGFVAPGRDPSRALHIDPGIEWATYLGGLNSTSEQVRFVKRDASGDIVVAGETAAADFPVTPGAFTTASLAGDSIFIAKFNSSGGLVFSSHIAPVVQYCEVRALALDSLGRATVCGEFWPQVPNPSFPTTPQAFDTVINTQTASGYVLRLSAQGDALVFSTLLQCPPWGCVPYGLDVAPSGATVVGGMVNWPTYPTTPGAYDTTFDTTNGTGIPEGL